MSRVLVTGGTGHLGRSQRPRTDRRGRDLPVRCQQRRLRGGVGGKSVSPGDYRGSERAASVFELENANWFFVNIQSPGITLAITGPSQQGAR